MWKRTIAYFLAAGVVACFAQAPAFDVASVKIADPAAGAGQLSTSPDTLTIRAGSFLDCIQIAWQMPSPRVIAPGWLSDVYLDILARAPGIVGEAQLFLMLRALLADRMGLQAHIEKREMPVLALTVSKGGQKFSATSTEGPEARSRDKDGVIIYQRFPMSDFALMLSTLLRQPVIDATGLTGRYDMRMNMTPYIQPPSADAEPGAPPPDPVGIMGPALQEELGLRLESRKQSLDVLVVDHAEKTPTAN